MKINNDALTPIIGTILVILIVLSSMSFILLWGIPYIEESKMNSQRQASLSNFDVMDTIIGDLIRTGAGATATVNLENNIDFGSISIDPVGDRLILMYSFDEMYEFNVSGLHDYNNGDFIIEMKQGTLTDVTIYWLNDTCFLAGTRVVMADGSYKNIEDVQVGDLVKSYDERNREAVDCQVSQVFRHAPEEMASFYLVINNGLQVTPNHRFYSDGRWVCAGDLRIGDPLFCSDRNKAYCIYSIEKIFEQVSTYDLEVEKCHTFFVAADDIVDVLVHNAPPEPPTIAPPSVTSYYNETSYTFVASGGNQYNFSWGDGEFSNGWGAASQSHVWDHAGFYEVRAKTKVGADESDWSEPLGVYVREKVRMPRDYLLSETCTPDFVVGSQYTFSATIDDLEGAVCIDLYDDGYPPDQIIGDGARGNVPFGRIWLFDLGSVIHTMRSSVGIYTNILENDAIMSFDSSGWFINEGPAVINGTTLAFRIIQIRNETSISSGSGKGIYKFKITVHDSHVRESIVSVTDTPSKTYHLKIQIYGDNAVVWRNYLTFLGVFERQNPPYSDTLVYTGGNKPLLLTSSLIKIGLEGIR